MEEEVFCCWSLSFLAPFLPVNLSSLSLALCCSLFSNSLHRCLYISCSFPFCFSILSPSLYFLNLCLSPCLFYCFAHCLSVGTAGLLTDDWCSRWSMGPLLSTRVPQQAAMTRAYGLTTPPQYVLKDAQTLSLLLSHLCALYTVLFFLLCECLLNTYPIHAGHFDSAFIPLEICNFEKQLYLSSINNPDSRLRMV